MEMLESLFSDRLWIYTGIGGSIAGALFLAYMKDTRAGLYVYAKFDQAIDFLRDRYGWTWLNQDEDAWKKLHPQIAKKLQQLETEVKKLEKRIERLKDV